MSEKTLMIVAKVIARPGKADELQAILKRIVEPSRAEAGCIHYDLYRSLDDQNIFLFHETWRDQAAIDSHNAQPHFKAMAAESAPLLQQPPEITIKKCPIQGGKNRPVFRLLP